MVRLDSNLAVSNTLTLRTIAFHFFPRSIFAKLSLAGTHSGYLRISMCLCTYTSTRARDGSPFYILKRTKFVAGTAVSDRNHANQGGKKRKQITGCPSKGTALSLTIAHENERDPTNRRWNEGEGCNVGGMDGGRRIEGKGKSLNGTAVQFRRFGFRAGARRSIRSNKYLGLSFFVETKKTRNCTPPAHGKTLENQIVSGSLCSVRLNASLTAAFSLPVVICFELTLLRSI